MKITCIGHNHIHDMDFQINRPTGSGDYLALLIKSHGLFYLNNNQLITPPNIFFLYKKGIPQYYKAYNEPFSNDWFHFDLEEGEEDFFTHLGIPFEIPIPLVDPAFFSMLISNMAYEYYGNNLLSPVILNHYIELFFLKLSQGYKSNSSNTDGTYTNKLNLLRSKIYASPYKDWHIDGLAHEITLSPRYFQKLYKEYFKVSCRQDIINARIEYAKCHLTETDLSIKYIAQLSGYANDVHFMRQFKEITNLTPSEYRTLHHV